MERENFLAAWKVRLATALLVLLTGVTAVCQETVLHSFGHGTDGQNPATGLLMDSAGNLYGTTEFGGIHGLGTIFELSPQGGGGYTPTVLHSFGRGTDGSEPWASVIMDGAGNLYGTTQFGGIHEGGTIFELSPNHDGGWTERVLHSFGGGTDGALPYAGLMMDGAGNLYGTTWLGGIRDEGAIFELSPPQGGDWIERVLHSFGHQGDGFYPFAGLIMDSSGNLYGTTVDGGIHGEGVVFELSPRQGGEWIERVLHSFGFGSDGVFPYSGLMIDSGGHLYGTTLNGGAYGFGTIFELSPPEGGDWLESVLHNFGNGTDGQYPYGSLTEDGAGNLYGTTTAGGANDGGILFQLSSDGGGTWTEHILNSFGNNVAPYSDLIMDHAGNFYGTTNLGGIHGEGTAFMFTP
jgi:uncharacterized repeat protein (TIGR03803 family)